MSGELLPAPLPLYPAKEIVLSPRVTRQFTETGQASIRISNNTGRAIFVLRQTKIVFEHENQPKLMHAGPNIIEILAHSDVFLEYARAYSRLTGLPIALRPLESWRLPFHGRAHENSFCALMASRNRTCSLCLQVQEKLCAAAREKPAVLSCSNGLTEAAVPVRLGNDTIGYLQTGQVLREEPKTARFRQVASLMNDRQVHLNYQSLKKAYFQTPVVSRQKLDAILHLLSIFADNLGQRSNAITVQETNAEPMAIRQAKAFIQAHHGRQITLGEVAAAIHMSSFYFCKMFKRKTGVNFTEFVSRTRIERARNLLLNPNLRVSEIAYEVGFQSLTHFNRVFKQILGQSPTEFREKLPSARRLLMQMN